MKKHPLQNRTNVQIKGGGGQRPFEQCSKKLHFFERGASLINTMKNKKEEFKTIFVHFLWTKAEQSWRSMYLATIKHRQFAKGTSDPRL